MSGEVFRTGEAVRIIDGPFVNFVGVVRAPATAAGVVKVEVGVRGRDVMLDVDAFRLERVR
ncbi:MAG: hypothetical protein HYU41_12525 [Candidatus Rokubacteria bacterium]|nr:hypothetical protein [Candidatus Rokubacteria bacterium]